MDRIGNQKVEPKTEFRIEINGQELFLTDIERNLWSDVPKAELFTYYHSVWDPLSRYLKDRPMGIHLNPFGHKGPDEWIRNTKNKQPGWVDIYITERRIKKKGKGNKIYWIICNREETLFYLINIGSIDLHPWSSRTVSPDYPDFLTIDLDPTDNDFDKVVETAKAADELFKSKSLKAFIKTSGKTGLHILIPVQGIRFGESRPFAENISSSIQQMIPSISTVEVSVNKRGNTVFIDPSQNDYSDRIAAPYTVRPYDRPLVSAPLEWNELYGNLTPGDFTIHTFASRLTKKGDLFKGLLNKTAASKNAKIIRKLF